MKLWLCLSYEIILLLSVHHEILLIYIIYYFRKNPAQHIFTSKSKKIYKTVLPPKKIYFIIFFAYF